ncbi:hypothetical protein SBW85_05885 [Vibrio plantisponsor]|uniref:Uncharacterized protein n=1 Tax=Vibrio plantisponsor TaxID=664643 RepID=A0ABU4IG03_9VIBR|nr:hypothetical protein [Vibrio plantisponsor]MDW6017305.1 hypothetical protein [Vibrio plantisponsor]NNM40247.1 hypothetical protein [Vibrio plantisponsor]
MEKISHCPPTIPYNQISVDQNLLELLRYHFPAQLGYGSFRSDAGKEVSEIHRQLGYLN